LEEVNFELGELVNTTLELLATTAGAKHLELSAQVAPDVPRHLRGDPDRLRQILLNLLNNGVKFTEAGSVRLNARVDATSAGRVLLRFEITDTGIGIPADRIDHLFKRFSQIDGSTTRKYGGTGLGLAICKQLAELMGGTVGVRSQLGRGSTFWFTVELKQAETPPALSASTAATGAAAPARSAAGVQAVRPAKILLVEDNEINRLVAGRFLEQAGYPYDIAGDGEEAVAAVLRAGYDLILMDCQMPRMDGYEATRRIRLAEKAGTPVVSDRRQDGLVCRRLPIVALTANAMKGDRQVCLAAGFDDYLTKPLERDHLVATLEFWLKPEPQSAGAPAPPPTAQVNPAPESPPMDLDNLVRQFGGDGSFLGELARRFDVQAATDLQRIADAIAGEDAKALRAAAHRLKGTTGSITAARAHAIARKLEELGIAGTFSGAGELLEQIRGEIERCGRYLKSYQVKDGVRTGLRTED
jgi:CheY-like chemotaxis protein